MQILKEQENIFGLHFLEASAGTGKTFAIEHLVVRLLLEGAKPLGVEEILVVTFTKAAARELKERIYLNIQKALKQLQGQSGLSFSYLQPFVKSQTKQKLAISALKEALALFDQAAIFTIHGFCFAALKRFSFASNLQVFLGEKNTQSHRFLKEKAFEYFYYYLEKQFYAPSQIGLLIQKAGSLEQLIENLLAAGLFAADRKEAANDVSSAYIGRLQNLWQELQPRFKNFKTNNAVREKIKQELTDLIPLYKKSFFDINLVEKEVFFILDLLEKKDLSLKELDLLLETNLLSLKFFQNSNLKKKVFLEKKQFLFFGFLAFLQKEIFPLLKDAMNEKFLFAHLAWDLNQHLQKKLEKEEMFTFDSLLEQMLKALKNVEFKTKLRFTYKASIVDEFQDTDPLQWQILSGIFLNHPDLKAFYLVGDPKQSIYSFRNADLYTYFQAQKSFGQKAFSTLDTNYRSDKNLMQSLNQLFSEKFSDKWLKIPKLNQEFGYLNIKAGKEKKTDFWDLKAPVHFWLQQRQKNKDLEEKIFFRQMAEEIKSLKKSFSLNEMAVLVKDRFQAERVSKFLEHNKIPAQYKSQKPLKETKAFSALKELFQLLVDPADLNCLQKVLLGRFFQYEKQAFTENFLQKQIEFFTYLKKICEESGLAVFFAEFLKAEIADSHNTVLSQMVVSSDLSFYQQLMQSIEFLIEDLEGFSLSGILFFLGTFSSLDPHDDGRLFFKPRARDDAVQIMTMHMSKGLEFAIVFAFGVSQRTPSAEIEAEAEKLRQLYVTMTRASFRIFLPLLIEKKKGPIKKGTAAPLELFLKLADYENYLADVSFIQQKLKPLAEQKLISCEWLQDSSLNFCAFTSKNQRLLEPLKKPKILPGAGIYSFSGLQKIEKENQDKEFPEDSALEKEPDFIFGKSSLEPGTEFGLLVHSLLEDLFSGFFGGLNKNTIVKILEQKLKKTGFWEKQEILFEMLYRVLHISLPLQDWHLKDIDLKKAKTESEFLYQTETASQDLMKGFVDLIFQHGNKFYLIDWKSNYLGDSFSAYKAENLKKALEKENYFLQAAIYTEALKKAVLKKDFKQKFGGIFYVFLRGLSLDRENCGIYHFYPELAQIPNFLKIKKAGFMEKKREKL